MMKNCTSLNVSSSNENAINTLFILLIGFILISGDPVCTLAQTNHYSSFELESAETDSGIRSMDSVKSANTIHSAKIDTSQLQVFYDKALRNREKGKSKALILRKLDWDRSEKYFQKIMQIDSTYKDVIYQYALLLRYRKKYEDAIQILWKQLRIRPDLIHPRVELFRFYRYVITQRKYKDAIKWLENESSKSEARYALAELYRRNGKYREAEELLLDLLSDQQILSKIPVYLSLCRLFTAQNKEKLVIFNYRESIKTTKSRVDASLLFEDLKYLITDREYDIFTKKATIPGKQLFIKLFWESRNPIPAASINHRIIEHYKRILYAEKYFEYYGFRTSFTNPDRLGYFSFNKSYYLNEEFNDKGVIHIRHGKPDDRVISFGDGVPANESWLYLETNISPRMIFHFSLFNTPNFWRVTPIIENPVILEDRLGWDAIYFRMLNSYAVERLSLRQEMAREHQDYLNLGLTQDRHTWDSDIKPLDMSFYTSSFKGDSSQTIFEIYNGFNIPSAARRDSKEAINVENGFKILKNNLQIVDSLLSINSFIDRGNNFSFMQRSIVSPDTYIVSLYSSILETNFIGGYKFKAVIPDYDVDTLAMSDIVIANNVERKGKDNLYKRDGLYIYPNPKLSFKRSDPMYIYFEIYNLNLDTRGNTEFIIEYNLTLMKAEESFLSSIFNIFGKEAKKSITTSVDREGKQEQSNEYIAIDVSNLTKGFYKLNVRVEDKKSSVSIKKERIIKFY